MNKVMAVVMVMLAAAVLLLSGAVFCSSKGGVSSCPLKSMFRPGPDAAGITHATPDMQRQIPAKPSDLPPDMSRGDRQSQPTRRLSDTEARGSSQQSPAQSAVQNQSQSREQVSRLMQAAQEEARDYFRGQHRRPEHSEMLAKVKEILIQKMTAEGIGQDVQRQVVSEMEQKAPPRQNQQ